MCRCKTGTVSYGDKDNCGHFAVCLPMMYLDYTLTLNKCLFKNFLPQKHTKTTLIKCVVLCYIAIGKGGIGCGIYRTEKNNNKKWDEKNLKRISLAVPIDLAEKLEQYLEETGMSKNGFIVSLIREKMEALGK